MKKQGPVSKRFHAATTEGQDCPRLHKLHALLGIHLSKKNKQLSQVEEDRRYAIPVEPGHISIYFGGVQMLDIKPMPLSGFWLKISGFEPGAGVQQELIKCKGATEAFFTSTFRLAGELPNDVATKLEPLILNPPS